MVGDKPSAALPVLPACSKGSTCFTQTPLGTTAIASILRWCFAFVPRVSSATGNMLHPGWELGE